MKTLINYSIETDQTVILHFKDGQRLRVAVDHLADHLLPADIDKINAALRLRQNFLRQHMPKAIFMLVASTCLAAFFVGSGKLAAEYAPARKHLEAAPRHDQTGLASRPSPQASVTPVAAATTLRRSAPTPKAQPEPAHIASRVVTPPTPSLPSRPLIETVVPVLSLPEPAAPAETQPETSPQPTVTPSPTPSPSPSPVEPPIETH